MMRLSIPVLGLLLATGPALAGMDDPGPYDAHRWLTIEDAETLIAPVCPGFRYPRGTDWRGRVSGRARVIDGDTIEVAGIRVRLGPPTCARGHGIDAPGLRQTCGDGWPCGAKAKAALEAIVGDGRVTCQEIGVRPSYNRAIMVCSTGDGRNLSAEMVRQGWAVEFMWSTTGYLPIRGEAARKVIGMWAVPFQFPWEWRASRRRGRDG